MRLSSATAENLEWVGRGLVVVGAVWGIARTNPRLVEPLLCVGAGAALIYFSRASAFSGQRIVRNPTGSLSYEQTYSDGQGGYVIEGEFVEVEAPGAQ